MKKYNDFPPVLAETLSVARSLVCKNYFKTKLLNYFKNYFNTIVPSHLLPTLNRNCILLVRVKTFIVTSYHFIGL